MNKNIQQLAAMVAVVDKSIQNDNMEQIISVDVVKFPETKIHITKELFLSTFSEYERGPLKYLEGQQELFVYLEGIRVFALTDIEGDSNAE
ncbi:hypothetical protein [Psychrobacillus sp. FSL H8-0487]|uniref:hypothetical protein n=1 Tax=Psychrobacillus sp. FSL H8-0487 TaxID=2921391 RepID=UPI0030F4ED45